MVPFFFENDSDLKMAPTFEMVPIKNGFAFLKLVPFLKMFLF